MEISGGRGEGSAGYLGEQGGATGRGDHRVAVRQGGAGSLGELGAATDLRGEHGGAHSVREQGGTVYPSLQQLHQNITSQVQTGTFL